MTRDETIEVLKEISATLRSWSGFTEYQQAIDIARETLEDMENSTGDYISRADAINAVHKYFVKEIDKTPHEIDEDGYDVYTDMTTVNSLLVCNKELSKALKALPSAEAVSRESYINAVGYVEWLEKLIVDSETFEWLCEDTNDEKWCVENCNYSSIQAECLRHLYKAIPSAEAVHKPDYSYEADMVRRLREYEQGYRQAQAEDVTNGRLIDADALSEKLCETTIFIKDGEVFQRMINDAPTESAEAVQGWIPCNERLPSEGEVVLASWSCLWKDAIVLARRRKGHWEWAYEHGADYWQPTEVEEYWPEAWMPLPKPYREEGE